jgi:CheY-like chemotaxis protein
VPIVALTASTQQEVQQACLQAGMNECLPKPFLRGDLLKVVRRHVHGAARRAAVPGEDRAQQPRLATT